MKEKTSEVMLNARYKDPKAEFSYDSVVRGIVGRPEFGRSWHGNDSIRTMTFLFDDEESAKKALKRLKTQKIKAELVAR